MTKTIYINTIVPKKSYSMHNIERSTETVTHGVRYHDTAQEAARELIKAIVEDYNLDSWEYNLDKDTI